MLQWLRNLFGSGPRPAGPPRTIRKFDVGEPTLTRDQISVVQDSWLIDARGEGVIRLFEIQNPQLEQSLLTYRARMKSDGVSGALIWKCGAAFRVTASSFRKGFTRR